MAAARDYRVWMLFITYGACFGVELTIHNLAAIYYVDRFGLERHDCRTLRRLLRPAGTVRARASAASLRIASRMRAVSMAASLCCSR